MSSVSSLKHIDHQILEKWLLEGKSPAGIFTVIDVRDSDYAGGHIHNSLHFPFNQVSLESLTELATKINDSDDIVFHCALSQQRGPSTALKFMRAVDQNWLKDRNVYVLKGGFANWQQHYGEDERLTDGYKKDIWQFGY
ncbi:hypothetical protein WICMUC_002618 [Wickerhamomyces mucosus]|uniref:Rhodanese domain-containing protein n=1 Tax=Wickerhamomyces mucosus TaxID=1378264 RepID=A0A9P8TE66_9ASCO|nr:hypothetical protein WICMUC_002618 [Wickerhamomyces mucosus]